MLGGARLIRCGHIAVCAENPISIRLPVRIIAALLMALSGWQCWSDCSPQTRRRRRPVLPSPDRSQRMTQAASRWSRLNSMVAGRIPSAILPLMTMPKLLNRLAIAQVRQLPDNCSHRCPGLIPVQPRQPDQGLRPQGRRPSKPGDWWQRRAHGRAELRKVTRRRRGRSISRSGQRARSKGVRQQR